MNNKNTQLGMNAGTAANVLKKALFFDFARRLNLSTCFRCGQKIESADELSIDHKVDWLHSENPKKLFFDLDNIALSHIHCNCNNKRPARRHKIGLSGFRGVKKNRNCPNKSWCCGIVFNKKRIEIGSFSTAREAALAYDKKAKEIFGKDAITNELLNLL